MSRFSIQDLDDIKARNPLTHVAGGYVKLRRAGGRLVGPCPICGGRVSSQRFEILDDGESWVCAVCPDGGDVIRLVQLVDGCDFRAAIERLGGHVETDPEQAKRLFEARERKRMLREKQAATYRDAERKRLYRTWKSALPVQGSPVEQYLRARGLEVPTPCPGLRYLPSAPYWHGETIDNRGRKSPKAIHSGPAMLAAFIRPDGRFGGLHFTWLDQAEPPGKIELHDPDSGEILNPKKMRGSKTGAHILIAAADGPVKRLVVGEGIETVLSVYTASTAAAVVPLVTELAESEFWAAGDLGNLAGRATRSVPHPTARRPNGRAMSVPDDEPDPDDSGLAIPDSVQEIILLGDGDSDPVLTRFAMTRAARRYTRSSRTVRIAFASAGKDFNDVLRSDD